MAEKRMISKVISVSEKVNIKLKDSFHMLLYTWMIPHTDDFGRLTGSPAKVRALIVPMLDYTILDVEKALQAMYEAELINWYEVNGDKYIEISNFEVHQSGLHKRTKSKIPDPPNEEYPRSSKKFTEIPPELKRTEQKGTEQKEKGKEEKVNATLSSDPSEKLKDEIHQLTITCKIENLTLHGLDELFSYIGLVDKEIIEAAVKKSEGKHVNYALKILKDMYKEGVIKKEHLFQKSAPGKQNIRKDTLPSYISDQTKQDKIQKEETSEEEEARQKHIKEMMIELGEWDEDKN